jgi:hypothetical protein
MDRRANGLACHSQQADMTCLGQSCGPQVSRSCRAAVWACNGLINSWRLARAGPPFGRVVD